MTPAEAIQNEIDRERAELERLDEELDRLTIEMNGSFGNEEVRPELLHRMLEILNRKVKQDEDEEEIRGKQEALQAVQDNPDKPVSGIGEIIAAEVGAARDLGRRAQQLREEAWREEQVGNDAEAQEKREEAKKLADQHKLQLARLRGKHTASREVERVLRKGRE